MASGGADEEVPKWEMGVLWTFQLHPPTCLSLLFLITTTTIDTTTVITKTSTRPERYTVSKEFNPYNHFKGVTIITSTWWKRSSQLPEIIQLASVIARIQTHSLAPGLCSCIRARPFRDRVWHKIAPQSILLNDWINKFSN